MIQGNKEFRQSCDNRRSCKFEPSTCGYAKTR